MSDFHSSTTFRDLLADKAAQFFYWVTLHDSTGGFVADDTYVSGIKGELPNENGYVRGSKSVILNHDADGILDGADVSWVASGGSIGQVFYAAVWVSAVNDINSAKLLMVKDTTDNPQKATDTKTMTFTIDTPITIPTPILKV